jgi:hypothetical protein
MSQQHVLADEYIDILDSLPSELRARKALEDELAKHLTGGNHVALRGFFKSGTTTLLQGVLLNACERTGGAAFFVDFHHLEGVATETAMRELVVARVDEFLKRVGALELKSTAQKPFEALGELAAPIFVGLDNMMDIALLEAPVGKGFLDALFLTPKNVHLVLVCHRHAAAEALYEASIFSRGGISSVVLPAISDEELVQLVQTPAQKHGVSFSNEALGALADLTGNRPWDLVSLCAVMASKLKPDFKGVIEAEALESLVDLEAMTSFPQGESLVENMVRILAGAMSPEERLVMEVLSTGKEGAASETALAALDEDGFIVSSDEGTEIQGVLLGYVAAAVAEGAIKVS